MLDYGHTSLDLIYHQASKSFHSLKGYSTFFGNRLILLIFLVSLTTIVYFFPTMEVNEIRNCLVTDILLIIRKPSEWIRK